MCIVNFFSDPELIYDKAKLCEDGLHDVLKYFPSDFSFKQLQPEMSGITEDLVKTSMEESVLFLA